MYESSFYYLAWQIGRPLSIKYLESKSIKEMGNKKDDILLNICAETQGCVEMDLETNEPQENCVYSRLIAAGYSSDILSGAGERDSASINFSLQRGQPRTLTKRRGCHRQNAPKMFKSSKHNAKCKLKIANAVSGNILQKEEKDPPDLSFAHGRIGIYERLAN